MKIIWLLLLIPFTIYSQWDLVPTGTDYGLFATSFVNDNYGFVFGESEEIIKTTDGGASWQRKIPEQTSYVYASYFLDSLKGWVSVIDYAGNGRRGEIKHTADGGEHWTIQTTVMNYVTHTIHFVNQNTGWITGSNGLLLKTTNGGLNWYDYSLFTSAWLYPVYFVNESTGWVSGNTQGVIYKTMNGGSSWQQQYTGSSDWLMSMYFIDINTGWAAGFNGRILKTTNGGTTWTAQWTPVNTELRQIYFKDANNGWAVGYNGVILRTTNGGNVWNQEPSGTTTDLFGISVTDEVGYVTGDNGLVLKNDSVNVPVPVELFSFTSSVIDNEIHLFWSTASEINNKGFQVQRRKPNQNNINEQWEDLEFINGNGTTTESKDYLFKDLNLAAGKYFYRLKQIDFDGTFTLSKEIYAEVTAPKEFGLYQNYPNPFNPYTTIKYKVPATEFVSLKVYDILGNEVAVLVNDEMSAGNYEIKFDAVEIPSGTYFYQMQAGDFTDTKKFVVVK